MGTDGTQIVANGVALRRSLASVVIRALYIGRLVESAWKMGLWEITPADEGGGAGLRRAGARVNCWGSRVRGLGLPLSGRGSGVGRLGS
jgi:hypothetical protein